jgi:PAS domain S-box-containing protein
MTGDRSMTAGANVQAATLVVAGWCALFEAQGAEIRPLLFLGDKDYPPITYLDGQTAKGVEIDLADALQKQLGRPIKVELMDWDAAQEKVLAGEADGLLGLTISAERRTRYDFAEPFFTHEFGLFIRRTTLGIRGIGDLSGKRVGVTPGGFPRTVLAARSPAKLVLIDNYKEGLERVADGTIDALAADLWVGAYALQEQHLSGITIVGPPFARAAASLAVKRGNSGLVRELNTALSMLRDNGVIAQIQNRWRPEEVVFLSRRRVRDLILLCTGVFSLVLIASMAGWVIALKKQIKVRRTTESALRESEERYRSLAECAPHGIIVSVEDRLVYANPAAAGIIRSRSPGELVGRSLWDFIDEQSREEVRARREQMVQAGSVMPPMRAKARALDGTALEIEGGGAPITYGGKRAIQNTFIDITQARRNEEALERQAAFDEIIAEQLGRLASSSGADIDEHVSSILKEIALFIGVDLAFVLHIDAEQGTWSCTHEWCAPGIESRAGKYQNVAIQSGWWCIQQVSVGKVVSVSSLADLPAEASFTRQRWEAEGYKAIIEVPLHTLGGPVYGCVGLIAFNEEKAWADADVRRLQMVGNAIANALERKAAKQRLETSRAQLRALTSRLQSLREEERMRISREIHDHLGQLLTALKLDLRSLDRRIAETDDQETRAALASKIESARELADEMITSVQKIASDLRPGILDRVGLEAAIEAEAQAFQSRTGIRCQWTLPKAPLAIGQEVATAAFRIFQEILTNVVRHAHATAVALRLSHEDENLALEVSDNGVGIRKQDIENAKSLGLLGMHERAAILGGKIHFDLMPGGGTVVRVEMPLAGQARGA